MRKLFLFTEKIKSYSIVFKNNFLLPMNFFCFRYLIFLFLIVSFSYEKGSLCIHREKFSSERWKCIFNSWHIKCKAGLLKEIEKSIDILSFQLKKFSAHKNNIPFNSAIHILEISSKVLNKINQNYFFCINDDQTEAEKKSLELKMLSIRRFLEKNIQDYFLNLSSSENFDEKVMCINSNFIGLLIMGSCSDELIKKFDSHKKNIFFQNVFNYYFEEVCNNNAMRQQFQKFTLFSKYFFHKRESEMKKIFSDLSIDFLIAIFNQIVLDLAQKKSNAPYKLFLFASIIGPHKLSLIFTHLYRTGDITHSDHVILMSKIYQICNEYEEDRLIEQKNNFSFYVNQNFINQFPQQHIFYRLLAFRWSILLSLEQLFYEMKKINCLYGNFAKFFALMNRTQEFDLSESRQCFAGALRAFFKHSCSQSKYSDYSNTSIYMIRLIERSFARLQPSELEKLIPFFVHVRKNFYDQMYVYFLFTLSQYFSVEYISEKMKLCKYSPDELSSLIYNLIECAIQSIRFENFIKLDYFDPRHFLKKIEPYVKENCFGIELEWLDYFSSFSRKNFLDEFLAKAIFSKYMQLKLNEIYEVEKISEDYYLVLKNGFKKNNFLSKAKKCISLLDAYDHELFFNYIIEEPDLFFATKNPFIHYMVNSFYSFFKDLSLILLLKKLPKDDLIIQLAKEKNQYDGMPLWYALVSSFLYIFNHKIEDFLDKIKKNITTIDKYKIAYIEGLRKKGSLFTISFKKCKNQYGVSCKYKKYSQKCPHCLLKYLTL